MVCILVFYYLLLSLGFCLYLKVSHPEAEIKWYNWLVLFSAAPLFLAISALENFYLFITEKLK